MSALGYDELTAALTAKNEKDRLVVSPLLDPKVQLRKGQAAIDVRLGRAFSLVRAWTKGVADAIGTAHQNIEPPLEGLVLDFGQPLIIHPHQFVLARTLEIVRLPSDLLAYVISRSSWGRRGLIVATAVVVHPNFAGPITLELKNVGEVPIALYPLDRIAQLAFHRVEGSGPVEPTERSQFASTFVPMLGDGRDKETARRLAKMIGARQSKSDRVQPSVTDDAKKNPQAEEKPEEQKKT